MELRKRTLAVAWLGLVALLGGCESTPRVATDFDETIRFERYRTFTFVSENPLVTSVAGTNPLLPERLMRATRSSLEARGYRYVENAQDVDFAIGFTLGTRDRIQMTSYPSYYGSRSWAWGRGYYEEVNVSQYTEGTLAIDVFDVAERRPVWHGWATKRISRAVQENPGPTVNEVVGAILADFPPA